MCLPRVWERGWGSEPSPRWAGLGCVAEGEGNIFPLQSPGRWAVLWKAVGIVLCAKPQSPCPFAETGLCALGRLSRCFAPDLTNSGTLISPLGIWGQLKRRGNMAAVQKLHIVIKPEERICVA